jgi:hypothetical protein
VSYARIPVKVLRACGIESRYILNLGKTDGKVRDLLTKAKDQGFELVHEKKCFKLYPPNKNVPFITISCTPSDGNFYWELRRMLKRSGFKE